MKAAAVQDVKEAAKLERHLTELVDGFTSGI